LIYSDLQTTIDQDGHSLEINIYRLPESDWVLEVVDEFGNSTVWDDVFTTDEAALGEALDAIKSEGIEAFVGDPTKIPD
jgi:hypothetical protein